MWLQHGLKENSLTLFTINSERLQGQVANGLMDNSQVVEYQTSGTFLSVITK